MTITELLPFINIIFGLGIIPLIKTLLNINKSLDDISTSVRLLEKDVSYKVSELAKDIEGIKKKLADHDAHIFQCNAVLKTHIAKDKGD